MAQSDVRSDDALELAILEGMTEEDAPAKVREYVDSDRMIDRLRVGESLSARVVGQSGTYCVRLQTRDQLLSFTCTCPSYEYPCKHARALALTYVEAPETFTDLADVRVELKRRSPVELVEALLTCLTEHPRLLQRLKLLHPSDDSDRDDDERWDEW